MRGDGAISTLRGLQSMRIAMFGAGYVGLFRGPVWPTSGMRSFASVRIRDKVGACARAGSRFTSRASANLVWPNRSAGRLFFTTKLKEAARGARAIFIAVGTPSLAEVGSADMRLVHDAARAIAEVIEDFTVVVIKSTVPVGAGDAVERIPRRARAARPVRGRLKSGIPARGSRH